MEWRDLGGGGGYKDVMAGSFPFRVKAASSQTCGFHKTTLFQTPTRGQYLSHVMQGSMAWVVGGFLGTKYSTPEFERCV